MSTKVFLRMYFCMHLLADPLFWGPVLILALLKLAGMTPVEIFFSEALATVLIVLLDAPSGVIADIVGRRRCIILAKLFLLASVVCFVFMTVPIHGYVANLLWAVGASLRSGAESAYLHDELDRRGELHEYPSLMKRCHSVAFLLGTVCTLAAGFLAEIDLRLPLLLSLPGVLVSTIIVFFLPQEEERHPATHSFRSYWKHFVAALHYTRCNKRLWQLMLWFALLGVVGKIYFFMYNPYLELVEVPYYQVGFIFAGLHLVGFVASRYAFTFYDGAGRVRFSWGFALQGVLMLIQAYFVAAWCGWLFCFQGLIYGYKNTIREPVLNREIPTECRATMLSFDSSMASLLQAVAFLTIAPLSGNVVVLLSVLGLAALCAAALSRRL